MCYTEPDIFLNLTNLLKQLDVDKHLNMIKDNVEKYIGDKLDVEIKKIFIEFVDETIKNSKHKTNIW